jgi:hypothetical protein
VWRKRPVRIIPEHVRAVNSGLRDIASMQKRVTFLRLQADEFRKLAKSTHDEKLAAELLDLAARCSDVAGKIEQNLPIHRSV